MDQRELGRTGMRVSALGFGCGNVGGLMVRGDAAEQRRTVARALEAGIIYFDTAPQYGNGRSEESLGRALAGLDAWGRVVVGTKVRLTSEDRADPAAAIRRSLEHSLRLLGRDSVDLLQLHNAIATGGREGAVPPGEVLGGIAAGMRRAVQDGLARHAGFTGLGEAAPLKQVIGSGAFASMQAYFNPLNPSAGYAGVTGGGQDFGGLIDAAAGAGMGVIAIRVLAAGALAGAPGVPQPPEVPRHAGGETSGQLHTPGPIGQRATHAGGPGRPLAEGGEYERDLERARGLESLAQELGLESPAELALRFVLAKPGVSTALIGYSDTDQLESAIRWAERGPLLPDAVRRVLAAAR